MRDGVRTTLRTVEAMASKWWTLLVVCLAIFMLLLDITVVNVALPDIQKELGASFEDLQWVVDAYALRSRRCCSPRARSPTCSVASASSWPASAAARGVPAPVRGVVEQAARRAYIEGLNEILVVAAVLAFVGAALALLLVRRRDFVTVTAEAAA